ncbi:exo-beta-N-acetylmuramidase NamZ family protein, partial [Streptomyces hydrogenans]
LYDCMVAAELAGKRFVVLDRPNPVSGRAALGPVLDRAFATFVGREPIAQAHGMTVAELALLFNAEFLARPVELETVRMTGWRRADFFDSTGLPWVPPSPNMPTPETALVYSGTCLFEGTNLSEGRGTTRPFELLGAEGVDRRWAEAANALDLPGVRFREAYFAPTFSKFQGRTVGGVQLHVHDREAFDPVRTGIGLLVTARRSWSGFAWRPDNWIDKLTGSTRVRTLVDAGADTDEVVGAWETDLAAFRTVRREHLLYR